MNLNELAKKPELIKLVIDDEDTVKEVGEAVEFWTRDRAPLETYLKLTQAQSIGDAETTVNLMKSLILDAEGKRVLTGDMVLPARIMARAVAKVVEQLGN